MASGTTLDYTIRFENLATASVAAQEVFVTHTLDADLDLATFALGDFGFGNLKVEVPAGRQFYETRIDLIESQGFVVDVTAELNRATREVKWTFATIDPATGDLISDVLAGFLPPNAVSPDGEGFVSYSVRPLADTGSGDAIDAVARIVFDTNAPIDTPVFTNRFDNASPTSSAKPLAATMTSRVIPLSWTKQDEPGGSGVAAVDLFVSVDNGPFTLAQANLTGTTTQFTGEMGHKYAFYVVATDNVGHREVKPAVATAVTTLANPAGNVVAQLVTGNAGEQRLEISGDAGNNEIELVLGAAGENTVRLVGKSGTTLNGATSAVEFVGVTHGILAQLHGGDDVIKLSGSSVAGPISLDGGAGNDAYWLAARKTKVDILDSAGVDELNFSNFHAGVTIDLAKSTGRSQKLKGGGAVSLTGEIENLVGSPFNDKLRGNAVANRLDGGAGKDTLEGRDGNDTLHGGPGRDKLRGGNGDDILNGGDGNDVLDGGAGNDVLVGGRGDDKLVSKLGLDVLIGGEGRDRLTSKTRQGAILIGGSTAHDTNDAALRSLLAEWSRLENGVPAGIDQRVERLTAGGGLNGDVVLTLADRVFDDISAEILSSKLGNNWFFGLDSDTIKRPGPTDRVAT